jgi:glycosyltransferase involved in cell wall biosynthesis
MTVRVALVDPYLGGSHLAWAAGLAAASRHPVSVYGHDARFWKWRMRGAHVTLADELMAAGGASAFDVVLATGMLDLAAFQGLLRGPRLPSVLYLHESQLTYPSAPGEDRDETYPVVNWVSCVAADEVWFNSEYHRAVFFEEVPRLLRRFPDHRHTDLIEAVADKSRVVPVGVDCGDLAPRQERSGPPRILWNHRWEHDKAPEVFLELVDRLVARGNDFRLLLAGERVGDSSEALTAMTQRHADRIEVNAELDRASYVDVLGRADIMVSTARQEFFGVALTEAMAAGVLPVVPDRLVYPERIPATLIERCCYRTFDEAIERIEDALGDHEGRRAAATPLMAEAARFDWSVQAPVYDELLAAVAVQK